MKDPVKWFRRRLLSFKYAFKGIFYVFSTQVNMKIHFIAAAAVVLMGIWLKISILEWLFVALAVFAVLVSEMINTAIEEIMDLLFPDFNEKVGRIKDIAAGVVLLFSIFAVIVGLVIFLPKISELFGF